MNAAKFMKICWQAVQEKTVNTTEETFYSQAVQCYLKVSFF